MITGLIVLLVLIGVVLYLVPMEAGIKNTIVKIVTVVAIVIVVIWLLRVFGITLPAVDLP